jgi:predicted enzyme related to lactoylglutathione lyase
MARSGTFVWYELQTTDLAAAQAFYEAVMGWRSVNAEQAEIDYRLLSVDGARVGGMTTLPNDALSAGAQPAWLGYVGVTDVDSCAKIVEEKGGRVCCAPANVPGHGRFAVLADPQGAAFGVFSQSSETNDVWRPGVPGFCGWHELYAENLGDAFDFYSSLFDWRKDQTVDLGAMGVYQLFAIDGVQIGGMMKRPPQLLAPFWNYYFNVDGAEAAATRVAHAGGQVSMGPHQTPLGGWILVGHDPQGVLFSLTSQRE